MNSNYLNFSLELIPFIDVFIASFYYITKTAHEGILKSLKTNEKFTFFIEFIFYISCNLQFTQRLTYFSVIWLLFLRYLIKLLFILHSNRT